MDNSKRSGESKNMEQKMGKTAVSKAPPVAVLSPKISIEKKKESGLSSPVAKETPTFYKKTTTLAERTNLNRSKTSTQRAANKAQHNKSKTEAVASNQNQADALPTAKNKGEESISMTAEKIKKFSGDA